MDDQEEVQPEAITAFINTFDQKQLLNAIAALQLSPKNQGKEVRLEQLVFEILKSGNANGEALKYEDLKYFFETHFLQDYMEDPTVSFFTENVIFFGGNYRIFPGINTDTTERLNGFLESIFTIPNDLTNAFKLKIQEAAFLLLLISDAMAESAGIDRYIVDEGEEDPVFLPEFDEFDKYYSAVKFSKSAIKKVCDHHRIPEDTIANFLVTTKLLPDQYDPYQSELITRPIIETEEDYICLIPATISKALCSYIEKVSLDLNEEWALTRAIHDWQESKLIDYAGQMGWTRVVIELSASEAQDRLVENIFQFDRDKLAYVCLVTGQKPHSKEQKASPSESIYERTANITAFLNQKDHGNTRVLTLLIAGGLQDDMMLVWPKPVLNNHNLVLSFGDFEKIIFGGDLEPLLLWKFAKAHNQAAQSSKFLIGADTLDLYGYYKDNHGSLLPFDHTPGYMMLMGAGTDYRRDLIQSRDEHQGKRIIN